MSMNPEVKAKWLEALRSGDYKQGKEALTSRKPHEAKRYCCLGVLCDLAVKEGVIPKPVSADGQYYYGIRGDNSYLPPEVMQWANLDDSDPEAGDSALSDWNDAKDADFAKIADLIEQYL